MTNVLRKRQNAKLRLDEMLQAIDYIHEDLEGQTAETLTEDRRTRQLVERNLEIIYEGQKSLLDEEKWAEPGIDWGSLRKSGNVRSHAYWKLSAEQVLGEVANTIPALKDALLRMRERMRKWDQDHPHGSSLHGRYRP